MTTTKKTNEPGTANGAGAAQEPTPEVNQRLYAHTEKLTGQGLYWDIILLGITYMTTFRLSFTNLRVASVLYLTTWDVVMYYNCIEDTLRIERAKTRSSRKSIRPCRSQNGVLPLPYGPKLSPVPMRAILKLFRVYINGKRLRPLPSSLWAKMANLRADGNRDTA